MSYDGDVFYELWRRGGNPDRVHPDACADARDRGFGPEEFADQIMRRAREQRESERQQEKERAYYEEQERQQEDQTGETHIEAQP